MSCLTKPAAPTLVMGVATTRLCAPDPKSPLNTPTLSIGVLGSGPVAGAIVNLTYPDGLPASQVTDSHGNAYFVERGSGVYSVSIAPPDNAHMLLSFSLDVSGAASALAELPKKMVLFTTVCPLPELSIRPTGTVSPSGITLYPPGSVVTVTATPAPGYGLDHWIMDGSNIGDANPLTITMDSNHTLVAVFRLVPLY